MTSAPPATSTGAELLGRAREVAPLISARAAEIEAARTLPADLVRQLREAELFRLAMPEKLGGHGIDPRTIIEIIEEISYADGSAGWCLLIGNIGNAFLAWLDPAAAQAIIAAEPHLLIAGGQAPLGQAVPDPASGGYQLSGRWPFGSGCLHSNWYMGGFIVMEGHRPRMTQAGMPDMRVAYFPASQARTEDTWHVAGLRGTGSHDIVADGILVPAEHTAVPFFAPASYPDPLFRLTAYNLLMTLMAGFPLGVARRALTEVAGQLAVKARMGVPQPWLDDPAVQVTIMRHTVALEAARRQLLDTVDDVLTALRDTEGSYQERARVAAAVMHAYDTGRAAATDAFRLAGTSALYLANPLQRCMRDAVAGNQHVAFSADSRKRVANALLGRQTAPAFFGV